MTEYSIDNNYVIDPDLMEEMHRLDIQGQLFTKIMAGLFVERPDFAGITHVLDLGCGSAEWALAVAKQHPDIQVVGVDKAPRMIEFAQVRAQAEDCKNATFQVVDVTRPLPFEKNSFDLVNARFIQGFMLPHMWSPLVKECFRVLRPQGLLRITEGERVMTNSAAWEEFLTIGYRAMYSDRRSFSPDGNHFGVVYMLRRFLEEGGFEHVQERAYAVNFSYDTEAHDPMCQDFLMAARLGHPFIMKLFPEYTLEKMEELREQMRVDAQARDFCGIGFSLSVTGEKPSKDL